jgi:acetylornithine deacetylase/succinyl-diaminopimelate desuccinylase-like protein
MSTVTDAGMLFVRCAGGISHNPAESVTAADVAVAIDVTSRAIDRLARAPR